MDTIVLCCIETYMTVAIATSFSLIHEYAFSITRSKISMRGRENVNPSDLTGYFTILGDFPKKAFKVSNFANPSWKVWVWNYIKFPQNHHIISKTYFIADLPTWINHRRKHPHDNSFCEFAKCTQKHPVHSCPGIFLMFCLRHGRTEFHNEINKIKPSVGGYISCGFWTDCIYCYRPFGYVSYENSTISGNF